MPPPIARFSHAKGFRLLATLRTVTLGCKVNQYETEYVRQGLAGIGYRDAAEGEVGRLVRGQHLHRHGRRRFQKPADDSPACPAKPRHADRRDGLLRHPRTGEVAALPAVAEVVVDKRELPDLLGRFGVDRHSDRHFRSSPVAAGPTSKCKTAVCSAAASASFRRSVPTSPAGRRPTCSTKFGRLVAAGYREIVLTGIHLGHYGVEWSRGRAKQDWTRLSHLLTQIMAPRRRLSRPAQQHRSDRSHARTGRGVGCPSPADLSPLAHFDAERFRSRCCAA